MRIKPLRLTNYLLVYFVSKPKQFIPFRITCFFAKIVLRIYRQREKSQRGQNHQLVNFESHFPNPNNIQTSRIIHQIAPNLFLFSYFCHSRPQRPRIATSGHAQHRKSAIHGLIVTLRMLRVKSDKSDLFWSQSIVFTNPFKTGMSLDRARGRDSWCRPKGAQPLGTRMIFCGNDQF